MLAWLLSLLLRALGATWRLRCRGRGALLEALAEGPVVVALLHGEMLPLVVSQAGLPFDALVSLSRDGEKAASLLHPLGFGAIRGSSSRGGEEALAEAERRVRSGRSVAITVDGPRGPAGKAHRGAAALAAAAGAPLFWARAVAPGALRLRSWDRFMIPLPFGAVHVHFGRLAPGASTAELQAALAADVGEVSAPEP